MTPPEHSETIRVHTNEDVVRVRQLVRARALEMRFSLIDQTKIVTAASEIARNALVYAGGGEVRIAEVRSGSREGLRLECTDQGPGIADVPRAMQDGFSTSGGLGLGLGGSRRLVDEFKIESSAGGTEIVMVKWRD